MNQLRAELERFWPGPLKLFSHMDAEIFLAFLERYPSPADAHGLGVARMQAFLVRERYSGGQHPAALMAKLRSAPRGRVGEQELAARRQHVQTYVAMIRTLNAQIKDLERDIRTRMSEHPDGRIFLSLFKSPNSVIAAAELPAEIGDCRERYPTRDALAADAGHAAVAKESGKRKTAGFQWGCNKRLRVAFCRLADSSRHWHPWAQSLYAQARQRGHEHPRAPDRRSRLVPSRVAMLAQPHPIRPRATPLTTATHHRDHPARSGPVPDLAATQRMAGAAVTRRAVAGRARSAYRSSLLLPRPPPGEGLKRLPPFGGPCQDQPLPTGGGSLLSRGSTKASRSRTLAREYWREHQMTRDERARADEKIIEFCRHRLNRLLDGANPAATPRYVLDYYTAHLGDQRAQAAEFDPLICREWWFAHEAVTGSDETFVRDVVRAAECTARAIDTDASGAAELVSQLFRYALTACALRSLSTSIPGALLLRLVDTDPRRWTPQWAITQARRQPTRAVTLAQLALKLPEEERSDVLAESLSAAKAITNESARAQALAGLAAQLPELLPDALSAAKAITNESSRAQALAGLAAQLPDLLPPDARRELLADLLLMIARTSTLVTWRMVASPVSGVISLEGRTACVEAAGCIAVPIPMVWPAHTIHRSTKLVKLVSARAPQLPMERTVTHSLAAISYSPILSRSMILEVWPFRTRRKPATMAPGGGVVGPPRER
jgi:hypothetical protein